MANQNTTGGGTSLAQTNDLINYYRAIDAQRQSGGGGNQNWTNPQAGRKPVALPKSITAPAKTVAPTTTTAPVTKAPAGPVPLTDAQKRQNAIDESVKGGGSWLTTHIKDLGLTNPNDIADVTTRFNEALGLVGQNVPTTGAPNVSNYYNYSDLLNKAVTGETGQQRATLQGQFQDLTPQGWQESYFGNDKDDPILRQIMNQQGGELVDTLDRKLARGQMTQGAYDYAKNLLGYTPGSDTYTGQAAGAYSNLQGLGGGVLSGYRSKLGDEATSFQNDITNFSLGKHLDPNAWKTSVGNKATEFGGGMEGDIYKALGNTQLFDPNALFAKAGQAGGGAANTPIAGSNPSGTGALVSEEDKRNIGSAGPF
jgi:hypothetical protein